MDEIAQYNAVRWKALAAANALFTRPYLDLEEALARARLERAVPLGDVRGRRVLCLAGGGGQQSAAFAMLGAVVMVLDLSPEQLARDREAAAHYGFEIETVEGDMRDLGRLDEASFDIVWQPYSLNFVPNVRAVFGEVARVIKPGGLYHFNCANPFVSGLTEQDWDGTGYPLRQPYVDGVEYSYADAPWVHGSAAPISRPREFRHTLSTLVNGLIETGFVLRHLSDSADFPGEAGAEPGTWEHFTAVAPPWLAFWSDYRPSAPAKLKDE